MLRLAVFGGCLAHPLELAVMVRLCLVLMLSFACMTASAGEAHLLSPNGGGSGPCPEVDTPEIVVNPKASVHAAVPARSTKPAPAKPTAVRGSGADPAHVQGPRWHSFLPGMFR